MNQIQWTTLAVFAGAFALISAAGIAFMVHRNRRNLDAKAMELKYREELFGVLADSTNDIFVMFSSDTLAVRYISPNIERLIGITAEEVMHDVHVISHTAVDPRCNLINDDMYSIPIGEYAQAGCERVHQGTGERRWYLETLYHLSIDGTEKFILVLSDRTEERLGNEILEQALDLARSSNEAKGHFLAKMSHDIRTPINAITGVTTIAQESIGDDEKLASCLDVIERSTNHLLSLINDVLDMSKIESGQLSLQASTCSIDEIFEEVELIIAPQAHAKNQSLSIDTSGVRHRILVCDKLRINQVLLNLLSNAVKYTPEKGRVAATVTELSQDSPHLARMQFTISDNGIGMPTEFLSSIFEPFARSSQNDVASIQGSGLGMPITKAIVDAMGGTIVIDSSVGKGSTFTVTLDLPIAEEERDKTPAIEDQNIPPYSYEGKRFLIVEDNELNAEILKELLNLEGAVSDWAENGRLGVEAFRSKPPHYYDAVLMDVMMPEMNGYEATQALRKLADEGGRADAADIIIVALTANAFADDVQAALESGMNAHVAKPVRMDDLGRTLAEVSAR
ncbi:MAG: response regulator [Eggerthellaceae bacterium]|nr:response regulator [Eggerthellaceae bacterium]